MTKENGKIVIRKCCGLGEVYHSDSNTGDKQCIKYSITSSSSLKIKTTKQQLLAKDEQLPPDFSQKNFTVVQGFPQNCSSEPYRLEPDLLYADKFFALESGQLLVPHRFWFFQSEDYCIEEFFEDKHFIKVNQSLNSFIHIQQLYTNTRIFNRVKRLLLLVSVIECDFPRLL